MKKVVLLAVPLLLAACAANINHNVATMQGKTYLIETISFICSSEQTQYV